MLLFPMYAVLVWYFAMRWRRRWPGFAAVLVGVGALWSLSRLLVAWDLPIMDRFVPMQVLLWGEILITGVVGLFISCLPRRLGEHECRACGYDLVGLEPLGLNCPECGAEWRGRGSGMDQPPPELTPIPGGPPKPTKSL